MMPTKLDWEYQNNGECHASHKGLRIRAVLDEGPANPFDDHDGNWPMVVYSSGSLTDYDKVNGAGPRYPLDRFGDHQLVHWQVHIAKILGVSVMEATSHDDNPAHYHRDAEVLREGFIQVFDDMPSSKMLEACAELYALIDVPCLVHESRGHSQGDWAKLLIVATPEACEEFFGNDDRGSERIKADMAAQAKLYDAWAWGDVYGYVVEQRASFLEPDDDPEDFEDAWEEIPDGSCWGFYGSDFDWSGLEESAMEIVDAHVRESVDA